MLDTQVARTDIRPVAVPRVPRGSLPWLLGLLGAAVGFAGSWIPSYWGDEAASVMSAERSWSSLVGLLGNIDAVHGLYYSLLRVWVGAFGATELATRLPSAIAVGLMVAGTVLLVREFAGERVAVIAGVVAIVLPRTTSMATEARSYAMGAAAAVWLTVLLIRLLRRRAGLGGWVGYAVAAAGCVYLFLYLGLILVVHGLYVAVVHRDRIRAWLGSCGVALVLALPIIALGYHQRSQIAFLARRDYATVRNVLVSQWFGTTLVAIVGWLLIAAAVVAFILAAARRGVSLPPAQRLAGLALSWLALPTAFLLLGNATLSPMYNVRYLSFCVPAAAILIALGVEAIGARLARPVRGLIPVALIAVLIVACLPVYASQRTPWAKDGGSDWNTVAAYVSAHATAGDAVIFDQATKPSRDPRIMLSLYPTGFTGLRDVALTVPYAERTQLWDAVVPNADAVAADPTLTSVWAVELPATTGQPADIAMLLHHGFTLDTAQRINRTTVYHLTKE